jgi:hypothetical protein
VGKLIVESTFTSTREVAKIHYPFFPLRFFMRDTFHSLKKLKSLKMPKLIIHGTNDSIIPLTLGKKLFREMPEPKEFYSMIGADHDNTADLGGMAYQKKIQKFLWCHTRVNGTF